MSGLLFLVAGVAVGWFLNSLRQAQKAYKIVEEWKRDRPQYGPPVVPRGRPWRASRDIEHLHDGRVRVDPLWELK